jgi:hypothetical protein
MRPRARDYRGVAEWGPSKPHLPCRRQAVMCSLPRMARLGSSPAIKPAHGSARGNQIAEHLWAKCRFLCIDATKTLSVSRLSPHKSMVPLRGGLPGTGCWKIARDRRKIIITGLDRHLPATARLFAQKVVPLASCCWRQP